jgi:hypothetical protein
MGKAIFIERGVWFGWHIQRGYRNVGHGPEPGTVALFGLGLATLLFKNRRRLAEGLPNRR